MDKKSRLEKSKAYQDDKYVKSWLVGLSERTKLNYLEGFSDWYSFMKMTPTEMIEKRTDPFVVKLKQWLRRNSGNVAISCHGNSLRLIRKIFEHLSLKQMLQLENPQDRAMEYALNIYLVNVESDTKSAGEAE